MQRIAAIAPLIASFLLVDPAVFAAERSADTFTDYVTGVARAKVATCPDFGNWVPQVDTNCDEWLIFYFQEGPPSQLREVPWILLVEHDNITAHPDGSVTVHYEITGLVENPQGSIDLKTFQTAQVQGVVPMSDGSLSTVNLIWDMSTAPLQRSGNNGPYNEDNDLLPHYADRCITLINHAHQVWRLGGEIAGVVDGMNVGTLFIPQSGEFGQPLISGKSLFTYVIATHGGCS